MTHSAGAPRPAYRDLPLLDESGDERHSWSHWGAGDPLGCLNDIDQAARLASLALVTRGAVANLTLPLDLPDPPLFGRKPYQHTFFPPSKRSFVDDRIDSLYPQASTQWDGFRHLLLAGHGYFGGVDTDPAQDRTVLGVDHWARRGIVGRGVLVDVSDRIRQDLRADPGAPSAPIEIDELRDAVDRTAGLRRGDILCLRTGWMEYYLAADSAERIAVSQRFTWPGLSGSAEIAEYLWDSGVSAVVADNPGVEAAPGRRGAGSLHRRALALLGMPFGELFDFEDLHAGLAPDGRSDFLFLSVPLHLVGGVGSTGNAIAMY